MNKAFKDNKKITLPSCRYGLQVVQIDDFTVLLQMRSLLSA